MIHNLSAKRSIADKILMELRSTTIQQDKWRFRMNLKRLSEIMAYEISKHLEYEAIEVETPLGVAQCYQPKNEMVLATILRAGLPMHQGFLDIFDTAENAFISAYRAHQKNGDFEINLQYITCPDLTNKTLILIDPMMATGASIQKTLDGLADYGNYAKLIIATAIASSQSIQFVHRYYPKAEIWAGAIDEELTAKSYIVPGLGDAGDLAYGKKLQD